MKNNLNEYKYLILSFLQKNYTKKQTKEALSMLEFYRYVATGKSPRIKNIDYCVKYFFDNDEEDYNDDDGESYEEIGDDEEESDDTSGYYDGDEDMGSDEDDGEGPYLWTAEDDACDECQDLDGDIFDEMPERPHPNCNCDISKYTDEDEDTDPDKPRKRYKIWRNFTYEIFERFIYLFLI